MVGQFGNEHLETSGEQKIARAKQSKLKGVEAAGSRKFHAAKVGIVGLIVRFDNFFKRFSEKDKNTEGVSDAQSVLSEPNKVVKEINFFLFSDTKMFNSGVTYKRIKNLWTNGTYFAKENLEKGTFFL